MSDNENQENAVQLIPSSSAMDDWKVHIPILFWLPKYKASLLLQDALAGLTVGIMSIPQGMALAALAGVNEVHGLYVAMLAPIVYCVLGTSGIASVALCMFSRYQDKDPNYSSIQVNCKSRLLQSR